MVEDNPFVVHLCDQLESLGSVQVKNMFGGQGVFLDNLMFGLISDDVLYLKADEENEQTFIDLDLEQFTYHKKGKPFSLSYFEAPESALDNEDELVDWAKQAYGAALRAAKKKKERAAQV
ncbi:MAG: DNA transformation protein [Saprospiraceae bacterium]|jgi:DNA transformation protein